MVEGLLERGVAGAWFKGGVRTKSQSSDRLSINFTEEDTEAKQDSPDRRRTAWTQGKLGGGWPPLGLRGHSSSLPRMESTSESSKSPTHPTLYKGLAPINLYINGFYKLFRTCLWMGQGVGALF